MGLDGVEPEPELGAGTGDEAAVRVGHLELDLEGPGRRVGARADVAQAALDGLPGDQPGGARHAGPELPDLGLGGLADHQEGVLLDHRRDRVADVEEVADLDGPLLQHAGEGRPDLGVIELEPGALERRLRGLEVGLGRGDLGLGLEAFGAELLGRLGLDPAHLERGAGLLDHRAALARIEPHQQVARLDRGAARRADLDDPAGDLGAQLDLARRRGLAVDHDLAADRRGHHLAHPHRRQRPPGRARGLRRRGLGRGAAGAELARQQPAGERQHEAARDRVGGPQAHGQSPASATGRAACCSSIAWSRGALCSRT